MGVIAEGIPRRCRARTGEKENECAREKESERQRERNRESTTSAHRRWREKKRERAREKESERKREIEIESEKERTRKKEKKRETILLHVQYTAIHSETQLTPASPYPSIFTTNACSPLGKRNTFWVGDCCWGSVPAVSHNSKRGAAGI